mgnify:CR=1 FL=1
MASGCYDLLHGGHIAFLNEAATYGRLIVSVGSDANVEQLKGKHTTFNERERSYILSNLASVDEAFVSGGSGVLDFADDLRRLSPDRFVVNEDGHTDDKQRLCDELGVEYIVLQRVPADGLPARESSTVKARIAFPYRVSIAGGWMDQPWVSAICPGSMVVASIDATTDFADGSGMATSSRKTALALWGDRVPDGDPVRNAKLLFGAENPPGTAYVSGSQDHIGLLVPGISRLHYDGDFWPDRIDNTRDAEICAWLSSVLHLVPLQARPEGYDPLIEKNLGETSVRKLGDAGNRCYESILKMDLVGLGQSLVQSLEAWREILPNTVIDSTLPCLEAVTSHAGATFSGCGGGYLLVASDKAVAHALPVRVRSES